MGPNLGLRYNKHLDLLSCLPPPCLPDPLIIIGTEENSLLEILHTVSKTEPQTPAPSVPNGLAGIGADDLRKKVPQRQFRKGKESFSPRVK